MYDGYAKGVLGWEQKDEEPSDLELEKQMSNWVGFIHHWAAHFGLTAFVDDKGDSVRVWIKESRQEQFIHKSDIYVGHSDPRKVVVGISGRPDLT
jgi:hypothetical protein